MEEEDITAGGYPGASLRAKTSLSRCQLSRRPPPVSSPAADRYTLVMLLKKYGTLSNYQEIRGLAKCMNTFIQMLTADFSESRVLGGPDFPFARTFLLSFTRRTAHLQVKNSSTTPSKSSTTSSITIADPRATNENEKLWSIYT